MDIGGRLHSAQYRSHKTMTNVVQNAGDPPGPDISQQGLHQKAGRFTLRRLSRSLSCVLLTGLMVLSSQAAPSQQLGMTGPQHITFAGLYAGPANYAQINAICIGSQGNLYLLIDQHDGVRILETDGAANNVVAQAQIGATGDIGLAMALDPAGNVYITGTTSSGALTASRGAAFVSPSGSSTNSFLAKFDSSLNPLFTTFAGGASLAAASIAATSDAVFITGSAFAATVPVTGAGIIQAPAYGSTQNGFVERFSSDGSKLIHATYLSGADGATTPSTIVADSADNAYIAGVTTSPGYPTLSALVPEILAATSGFLTKLTPAGDGILFSTYIPGTGASSLAIDTVSDNLLLSGGVSLGQFPVTVVSNPLAAIPYQTLLRMPLDGSSVVASTVLGAGTQSLVAADPTGGAWVVGSLSLPLLPLTPLSSLGQSFAVHVNSSGAVDQTARFGGLAGASPASAGAPVNLTSLAVDTSGALLAAGSFAPWASSSLLATETYDLPLTAAPTSAFPSSVRAAIPLSSACSGSLCSGSEAYLARLAVDVSAARASAGLALSVDDTPNLTLRNVGSADATNLAITVAGFTYTTNCGPSLPAGEECSILLNGSGPGSVTASAANSATETQALPAISSGANSLSVVFAPKELDFGIVSASSGTVSRTITVTNLTQQSQTFLSTLDTTAQTSLPYSFAETASDCALAGSPGTKLLAPGGVCHISIGLTASSTASNDGPIRENWRIGTRDLQMTAFGQAAALALSATELDFGTQYAGGLRLPRYLYLSNNSTAAIDHTAVTLPASSKFSVTDSCPSLLEPYTVCQLQLGYYSAAAPSVDSVTLALDQGLTALVTGRTLPQPATNGSSVNPNLAVSASALTFSAPVPVTSASSGTQSLTIQNTGATPFSLSLALTGDFTDTTNCGATLAGNASCSVVLTFTPSQPGTRGGLLTVTAGAGTTPVYVTLSGISTGILSPANNGTIGFGEVIAGQPSVQWIKVTQPYTGLSFATASATLGSPFTAILVEDIGYGHGQPPSSTFATAASGTCYNCWLGVQFRPQSTGYETGTLTLTSSGGGSPYVLTLSGTALPVDGLLLTPAAPDFGPVPVNSESAPTLFTLTNLSAALSPITLGAPSVTGDFVLANAATGGQSCGGTLAYGASCFLTIAFAPTSEGPRTGSLNIAAGNATATAALTGYGSPDPGLALNPTALVFENVPGTSSSVQQITVINTGVSSAQIGQPLMSGGNAFSATSGCSTLVPAASCTIAVSFTPQTAPAAATLSLPVTVSVGGAPVLSTFTIPLTGAYTSQNSGLQILPGAAEFGPQTTAAFGLTRQFTVNNLTAKSLELSINLPRQFVLAGAPCSGLAPSANCTFSVSFLPLTNGDIPGTVYATGIPSDGSATLNGIGYVEGYGMGSGSLSISGSMQPAGVLSFGQVPSGQSVQRTLTLTNSSLSAPVTIRRVTSEWPFLSTTTCGATLAPSASCAVTLDYTPINQVAAGTASPATASDNGSLVIESDSASSPDIVDLTGTSTASVVSSPLNTAPLAAFAASPSSLTFDLTPVGAATAPQTVTLSNTGTTTISILGIQTSPDFTVVNNCSVLVAGANCTLDISFTPQSSTLSGSNSTARIGAIEINSNAGTSLEFVSLTGEAAASALVATPSSLTFGTILVGRNSLLFISISNTGSSSVSLGTVAATGDFTVANGTCPPPSGSLAAGSSCTLQVTFAPTQFGSRSGVLSIANSMTSVPLSIPLAGNGIQSQLQISPGALTFGSIAVGSSASLSLTLSNTGSSPITGILLSVTGDYSITSNCGLTTLAPGGSCSVTIAFVPSVAGARLGTLTIMSSDPASPAAVSLTGTGTVPPAGSFSLTVQGPASQSISLGSGAPADYALVLTPLNGFVGAVVLNCTPIVQAPNAACSLLPSSVTLNGSARSILVTISTVTASASNAAPQRRRTFGGTFLCLLFPAIVFTWKARTSRHRAWRTVGPIAWAIFASVALLTASACGGDAVKPSGLLYAPAGSYQYQVTANSTGGAVPVTQSVTLNLTVQ